MQGQFRMLVIGALWSRHVHIKKILEVKKEVKAQVDLESLLPSRCCRLKSYTLLLIFFIGSGIYSYENQQPMYITTLLGTTLCLFVQWIVENVTPSFLWNFRFHKCILIFYLLSFLSTSSCFVFRHFFSLKIGLFVQYSGAFVQYYGAHSQGHNSQTTIVGSTEVEEFTGTLFIGDLTGFLNA